jgi:hypothetical protein
MNSSISKISHQMHSTLLHAITMMRMHMCAVMNAPVVDAGVVARKCVRRVSVEVFMYLLQRV